MSDENKVQDQPTETNDGLDASQATNVTDATGAPDEGQQPDESQDTLLGQQEDEDQPAEDKPEGPPESYEFETPEGIEVDAEVVSTFTDVARDLGLTQDAAQTLMDKMAPIMAQRRAEQLESLREQWAEDSKADKEFGGDRLNENLGLAKKAMDKFATPEFQKLLNESGMGNHPELIRTFVRVGKSISEDTFVSGTGTGARPGDAKSFYPNSQMN